MKNTKDELNELKPAADGVPAEEVIDADALMAELDRESNTRSYSGILSAWLTRIVLVGIIGFILYCIVGFMEVRARKSVFTGLFVLAGYLLYPRRKGEKTSLKEIPWLDGVMGLLAAVPFFYFAMNVEAFIEKATKISTFDVIVALVGIILLFELCRRVIGMPIMVVAGAFIVYMVYHCLIERGFTIGKCISTLVYQLFTRFKSPVYLGSSFAFLGSMGAAFAGAVSASAGHVGLIIGAIMAGLVYVVIAIVVKFVGVQWINRLMPAAVIGPTVAIIGLSLASNAIGDLTKGKVMVDSVSACSPYVALICGLITLFSIFVISVSFWN